MTEDSNNMLSQRTLAGGVWLLISRFAQQGANLVQITILARLLDPKDFGLFALANLATTAIGVFVYTGFDFAIIQKKDLKEVDVHTAWWVILGRYLLISAGLAVLAKPIASVYREPEAVTILLAFALYTPVIGFAAPSIALFRKNMQFHKIFWMDGGSALAGLIVGIATGIIFRNVWALILAGLASSVTVLILSYRLHPYRPKWEFSRSSFKELSGYGQWILGSAVLSFIASQGSSVISGWMFGLTALGLYQMASRFALLPGTQIGEVLQTVLMPAYSKIQDDKYRVSKAFIKTLAIISMLLLGITGLFALGLPRILVILLGDQWIASAELVPFIAIAGGLQAILRTGYSLYLGTGHPRYQFFIELTQALATAMLLYPLGRIYGLSGLPYALIAGSLCCIPIWWLGIRRSTFCTLHEVIRALLPSTLGVVVMALIFLFGQTLAILHSNTMIGLCWYIGLMAVACLGFLMPVALFQGSMPQYAPLLELKIIANQWLRR